MKTYHLTTVVHDGEFEYWQKTTIEARTPESAEKKWARENGFKKAGDPFGRTVYQSKDAFDYRYYGIVDIQEACPCCHGKGIK